MTGDHAAAPTGAGTSASPTVSMPFDPPARTRRAMLWLGIALLGAMGVLSYAPRGTIAHLVAMAVGVGVGLAVVRIVVRYGGPGYGPWFTRILAGMSAVASVVAVGWSAWLVIAG